MNMKRKYASLIWALTVMLAASVFVGCGKKYEPAATSQTGSQVTISEETVLEEVTTKEMELEETSEDLTAESESAASQESSSDDQEEETAGFSFGDVAGMEFYFSSGAGGWYEVLHIKEDGTFTGHFQDSNMGEIGENYPNGVLYYSDYNGSFTTPEKVDDTTWRFRIAQINYPFGTEEKIIDGTLYRYSTTYGLEDAKDLYMYLPGAKLADLPQEFLNWVGYHNPESIAGEELTFYGLYNAYAQTGFQSYKYEPEPASAASEAAAGEEPGVTVAAFIRHAEEASAGLEESLQNGSMSQADMNQTYMEIYTIWDETLNAVWSILKENLDEESMANLTADERAWIAEKEQAVQEAAAEYEGGTMQPLAANSTAAEMTKERVYELAKYVNVWQ